MITKKSIKDEIEDLIAELQMASDCLDIDDYDVGDLDGIYDDLECQSGTVGTILEHMRELM